MVVTGNLFFTSVLIIFTGGILSGLLSRNFKASMFVAHISTFAGALLMLSFSIVSMITGQGLKKVFFEITPWASFNISADNVSAFFLLVVSLSTLSVSIYSLGYLQEYQTKKAAFLGAAFNFFVLAMYFVVTVDNVFSFLLVWEIMSIVSYFLVITDHKEEQVKRAGFTYIVMTHLGTVFISVLFLILFRHTGSLNFSDFNSIGSALPKTVQNVIFVFSLIGFGTKAGLMPLHVWLPKAHPVAPSHVSALMSGVMIKTAVYGLIRVLFEFLGSGYTWWGIVLLLLGTITAFLGIIYALVEKDLKKLLAYSSIENIGIITASLGITIILKSYGYGQFAAIALTAGMYHLLNHSVFKNLLFMGAGSVLYATHTKNIDKMGGLIKKMPWTALFFLIGAMSVSALPPFNGFISEWLLLQSVLVLGISIPLAWIKLLAFLIAAILAFSGALVAATFVKAFGLTFLAMPRSRRAAEAGEVPASMLAGMGLSSCFCLILGVLPSLAFRLLSPVSVKLTGYSMPVNKGLNGLFLTGPKTGLGGIIPFVVLGLLIALIVFAALLPRLVGGKTGTRVDETWTCGETLTPEMEYTGTSFAQPFEIVFKTILMPHQLMENNFNVAPYFGGIIKFRSNIKPRLETYLYKPIMNLFLWASNKVRIIQSGSIHTYLSYIFVTLVVLLIFAK